MILRVARHTSDIEAVINFYVKILGFEVEGEFENHDGYDGVFLKYPGTDWHLEFTENGEPVESVISADDYLVLYPSNEVQFNNIQTSIIEHKIQFEIPRNPYWRKNGIMILDPMSQKIIISPQKFRG